MPAPWSAKGAKNSIVGGDEFLILDSQDATPATKNKRVRMSIVEAFAQSPWVVDVDAANHSLSNLSSLSINDSASNNTFTISSSVDLAANRTINLPLLTADDTFAMLGVSNTFSENNTFEKNILMTSNVSCASLFMTVAADNGLGARIVGQFTRGTIANPSAIQSGDRLYTLLAAGFDGTIFDNAAFLIWTADGNWSGSNHGASLTFTTTPTDTTTPENNIVIKNRVISFEDNDLDNIKSIKLNDASDDNKFTILGAELTTDRTATIPPLIADDTFAMLGTLNVFTNQNNFQKCIAQQANVESLTFFQVVASDSGNGPIFDGAFGRGVLGGFSAVKDGDRLWKINIRGVESTFENTASMVWNVDGDWTATNFGSSLTISTTPTNATVPETNILIKNRVISFEDNDLTNVVLKSNIIDGSILVGNENNVSEDFPAKLQTKEDCRVATTEPGTLVSSFEVGDTIDTVVLILNNRILIKNQADSVDNGIYTVNAAGAPSRAADANQDSEVNNGMFTKITEGSANINTAFVLSTPDDITLGVTNLTFDKFSFSDIAHLNTNNIFTGANTWTDDLVQLEDNTSQNANFKGEVFSTSTVEKTRFQGIRAAGTKLVPSATTSGSVFVDLEAVGFDGTLFNIGGSAGFDTPATWSGSSRPTRFSIFTTNIGSTTNVENFVIDADGTADFKANTIENIKSIKLNDSNNTHKYTILGDDLSSDVNVTIPSITTSDTFALLNVQNDFTQRQLITLPISSIVDGLSIGNADGQLVFGNNTEDVGEFAPLLSLTSKGSDNPSTIQALIAPADDTGTTPASVINIERPGGAAITARPLWEIQNNKVTQVSVAADGDWDFKGNAISDIGTLDYNDAIATIVTGVLTTTVTYQSVAGEGAAADDLVTITAGTTGQYLIIRPSNGAVTITVKNTGNIVTIGGNDFVMDDIEDTMTLIYDGANWIEISRNVTIASNVALLDAVQTFTEAQTIATTTATDLTLTPPTAPTGSSSEFIANLAVSSGTIAFATTDQTGDFIGTNFAIQTLTNPTNPETIVNAATLRIAGEPVASTNVTITNNTALHVESGLSRFDGNIQVGSGSTINDSNGNELIVFPSVVTSAVNEITILNTITGVGPTITSSGESNIDLNIAADGTGNINLLDSVVVSNATKTNLILTPPTAPTGSSSEFIANLAVSSGTIAFATTDQTGDFIGTNFAIQTLTNPTNPETIVNAATLRIAGEPVASTNVTITNNTALHVESGLSRFDGNIQVGSGNTINDSNGNELIVFPSTVASAVNEITILNSAAASPVTLTASGDDTNIDVRFIPKGTGTFYGVRETFAWPLIDETTAPTVAVHYTTAPAPYDMTIEDAIGGLTVAGTGAALFTLDVLKEDSVNADTFTTIFSTTITIDASEFTSTSAATAPVISVSTWEKGRRLQLSVTQLDTDTLARGPKIELITHATAK